MGMEQWGMMLGVTICALVAGQLTIATWQSFRRYLAENHYYQHRRRLLDVELAHWKARWFDSLGREQAWEGLRKFRVERKVQECADCYSFYLQPHDGKPLPRFSPGQYLTFSLRTKASDKPLVRCYSLSDCPRVF